MKSKDLIKELLEHLPEAQKAIETKGNYNGYIQDVELLLHQCYYCEDCNQFHEFWSGEDLIIENGIPEIVQVSCDSDGNWETDYSYGPNDDIPEIDWDEWQAQWDAKEKWEAKTFPCKHCLECGEEPIMVKRGEDYCEECKEHLLEEPDFFL